MSCTEYETVSLTYLGHDNATIIIPYSDFSERVNYDMTSVTQVDVSADLTTSTSTGDDVTANSTDDTDVVWFNNSSGEWRIYMRIGRISGITAGDYKVRVVITEVNTPNGVVVCDDLLVSVVDVP